MKQVQLLIAADKKVVISASFGGVFTPWEGLKLEDEKILSEYQTTCPYTSNKLSYIKFGPFLGALLTFLTFFDKR